VDNNSEVEKGKLGSYLYQVTPIYVTRKRLKSIEKVNISYGQYRDFMFHQQIDVDDLDELVEILKLHTNEEDIVNFNYSYQVFELSISLASRITAVKNSKAKGDNWFSLEELENIGVTLDPLLKESYSHVIAEGTDLRLVRDEEGTPHLQAIIMPNSLVHET
jgi:hypothetical protein